MNLWSSKWSSKVSHAGTLSLSKRYLHQQLAKLRMMVSGAARQSSSGVLNRVQERCFASQRVKVSNTKCLQVCNKICNTRCKRVCSQLKKKIKEKRERRQQRAQERRKKIREKKRTNKKGLYMLLLSIQQDFRIRISSFYSFVVYKGFIYCSD